MDAEYAINQVMEDNRRLEEENVTLRARIDALEGVRDAAKRLTWNVSMYQLEAVADALRKCEPC